MWEGTANASQREKSARAGVPGSLAEKCVGASTPNEIPNTVARAETLVKEGAAVKVSVVSPRLPAARDAVAWWGNRAVQVNVSTFKKAQVTVALVETPARAERVAARASVLTSTATCKTVALVDRSAHLQAAAKGSAAPKVVPAVERLASTQGTPYLIVELVGKPAVLAKSAAMEDASTPIKTKAVEPVAIDAVV